MKRLDTGFRRHDDLLSFGRNSKVSFPVREEAALAIFQQGGFDAILSDDIRFVRRLRALGVPYITPAVCIVHLLKQGEITLPDALEKLELLSPLISSDEYNTVKWALDTWRSP